MEESLDRAALLRRQGVQVTAQRLAVLRAVSVRPHSTAADIGTAVRAEIGVISNQAIYDALAILTDKGIVRRIQPAGSPARYEDRVGDNHHHLICRTCGQMVDVDLRGRRCALPDRRRRPGLRDRRGRGDLLGPMSQLRRAACNGKPQ